MCKIRKQNLVIVLVFVANCVFAANDPELKINEPAESGAVINQTLKIGKLFALAGLGFGLVPTIYFTVMNKNARAWVISYFVGFVVYLLAFEFFA